MVTSQLNGSGLEVRSAVILFVFDCSHTPLQDAIISGSTKGAEDPAVSSATTIWKSLTRSSIPVLATKHSESVGHISGSDS